MEAFAETVAALGKPVFSRTIGENPAARIARWQHGDARIETNCADAVRVCLSLRGGHIVRHGELGNASTRIVGSHARVYPADRYSSLSVKGHADIVQIFIDPFHLKDISGVSFEARGSVNLALLRANALQLFLGARGNRPDDSLLMETSLARVVDQLVLDHVRQTATRGSKLPERALQRVDQLIKDRFAAHLPLAPTVKEMARVARMSETHFIRAFTKSTGSTPYQHVLSLRIEMATGLLAERDCSVAEVADIVGYSSPAHFVSSFRQRLGITPEVYRRIVLA